MICIRADANEIIGTGHVMRCLSLASAFDRAGYEVLFITADHRGDNLIHNRGFKTICLESDWTDMDAEPIIKTILKTRPELMVVDSYYVTMKYLSLVRSYVSVAYIDDFNLETWDANYVINYNIYGTLLDYTGYERKKTELLLGPIYAPLRSEFTRAEKRKINKRVNNVMVSAGGSDPERITEKLMKNVCRNWEDIQFHFIVGALNPRLNEIKIITEKVPNVTLHVNEQNMSELMKLCDIAISAAGSTLYELCACGTPTITYTLADNQLLAAEEFDKKGIMLSAGDCRKDNQFIKRVDQLMKLLVESSELRENMSMTMQKQVDGKGADRIVNHLLID